MDPKEVLRVKTATCRELCKRFLGGQRRLDRQVGLISEPKDSRAEKECWNWSNETRDHR